MSERKKGAQSVSLLFRLTDSTTGAAKPSIDVTTLKLQYARPGEAASTATSLTALAALTTAWTAFGAKEIDSTNSKGVYRVDCPDAGFATGADEVEWSVTGTGIEPSTRLIDLTAFDARDAVRAGLTSLPNAAAGANNGLPLGDASGRVTVGTNSDKTGYALTTAPPTAVQIRQEIDSNSTQLALALGLLGVNTGTRNQVYDATTKIMTSADLCIYDTPTHAILNDGTTGLLHKLSLVVTISGGYPSTQVLSQVS